MTPRRIVIPVIVAALAFAVAACGSSSGGNAAGGAATTAGPAKAFNDADVEFAQGMIAHHEQAVEMSEVALDPATGAGAKVTALATRIKAAQDPEIVLMSGWLTAWGKPVQMDTSGGHEMSSMSGMMSAEDMDALGSRKGKDFDGRWLTMMVEHHSGAITMAEAVNKDGSSVEVRTLAGTIIAAQQGEITEMKALLAA